MKTGFVAASRIAVVAVALLKASGLHAQDATDAERQNNRASEGLFGDNRAADDEEDEFRISGRLSLGGQLLENDDLVEGVGFDRAAILPEARLDLTYQPDDEIEVFVSFESGLDFEREDGDWETTERFELREAYVLIDDAIFDDVEFQVGRQDFEDGREWLYDERLDGVRLAYDHQDWRVELAYGREELVRRDLLNSDPARDKIDNFIFHTEYEVTGDWDISVYAMKQEDRRASNISPFFYGIQSEGRIIPSVGHWFEYARQTGSSGTRQLRGNAIDAGLIWYTPLPAQFAVFGGYARGSGGGDATTDRSFRQSGLQDNEDRITGLGNVRYYGELLDPDLSNIQLWTLGAGIRPTAGSSLELLWHRYDQVSLDDDDISGSPIVAALNGINRSIGSEFDLAGAVRLGAGLGLEAKLAWFRPGNGFDAPALDDAYFAKVRLVFRL